MEKMEREMGLEPTTSSLGSWHSTTELLPLVITDNYNKNKDLIENKNNFDVLIHILLLSFLPAFIVICY